MMHLKRIIPIIALISSSSLAAVAADYLVSGKVVSKEDREPVAGATYKVFLTTDTITPAAFNVTDGNGYFNQKLPKAGDYIIKVSFIGMKDASREFTLTQQSPSAGLGAIALQPADEVLEEVVVVAKKKLIESDGATLTYNMENDPEASTNSTLEMLRKVPMVTVDAEDNIKVNGSSNFKIFINGKEDPMLSGDVSTILKSMPAATIKKIEVITEPGAKYDAEGSGGILNIVTIGKQTLEGYMANLSARVTRDNYGFSAYGRTKVGNVTTSANMNFNDDIDTGYDRSSSQIIENLTDDENRWQKSDMKYKSGFGYWGGNINLSWEPDTLNLFTIQGNIGKMNSDSKSLSKTWMENIDLVKKWSLDRDNFDNYDNQWLGANTSFQHTFRKKGHHIVASYIFGYRSSDDNSTTLTHNLENYVVKEPYRRNDSRSFSRRHALQIDYANPITEQHLLEAGFKGTWSRSHQHSMPWYGTSATDASLRESEVVRMVQFQDIMALYASYTGNFGKWNTRVGLRYEYTNLGLDYSVGDYPDFSSHLNDLVPNVSVSYRMKDAANLRLAYQMRISRPYIGNLNPYRNTMSVNQVSYGNPDLDSEKSNYISLTYSNYGGKLGGSFGVSYMREDNSITDYQFFEDGVLNTTYANLGHSQRTNFNLNLQWSAARMLNIGVYVSGTYVDLKASSPELSASNHGWTTNFNANVDYTFPFKLRLSAYGGYGSGWLDLQTKGSGYHFYGMSLSRSFFKKDLMTVTLFGSNFFEPHRTSTYTQTSETSKYISRNRFTQWSFGGSITFRFGNLKADVKRTDADIEMIDGGSSGGGGGKG